MEKIIKILLNKLCLAFLILTFALPVWAGSTYYVKSGGNDNLDGLSNETAWATIAKVEATVTNGDTVYFRSQDTWTDASPPILTATAGVTYDGTTYGSGTRAILRATGNPASAFNAGAIRIDVSNVILKGFDIDGGGYATTGIDACAYYIPANFSNVTIDDCVVHDHGGTGTSWTRGIYIGSQTGNRTISNITVKNTTVYNVNRAGIVIYPQWRDGVDDRAEDVLIQNCTIYNTGLAGEHADGIIIKDDVDNIIVENCEIYNNPYHGINVETSNDLPSETDPQAVTIRNNYIHDNKSSGIAFMNGPGDTIGPISIYNNLIINNGHTGGYGYIGDISMGYNMDSSVINFYNNTIYNTDEDNVLHTASVRIGNIGGSATVTFRNNIIFTVNDRALYDAGGVLTHSNNLIYRSSADTDAHVYSGGTTYDRDGTASDLTNWEATAQKTDSLFVDVSNVNYNIGEGSDAIDNGADLSAHFTTDYYGKPRPIGSGFEIGAHEYQDDVNTSPSAPPNFCLVTP